MLSYSIHEISEEWISVCRNLVVNHEMPLHCVKFHVWFAMSAAMIVGSVSSCETINSHPCVNTHCDTIL